MAKSAQKIETTFDMREAEFEKLCNLLRNKNIPDIAYRAEVSPVTLYKWLDGSTVAPRIINVAKVAAVIGYRLKLVKIRR